jgi:hypothetical protein
MCEIDWAEVRAWVGTLAELSTALIALLALLIWRSHLRGANRFRVAHKVLEEAHLLRYFFYDARNPIIDRGEFPAAYFVVGERTRNQEADGHAFVFNRRYKMVRRQVLVLARLRARAAAALGDDTEQLIEALVRKAGELHGLMSHRVGQIRAGDEVVAARPNQDWELRVRYGSQLEDPATHDDPFSQEFDSRLKALEERLARYR